MGCSVAKIFNSFLICLFILVIISLFYYDISLVKEGYLKSFIYGKDFENNPCGLMDGKQRFKLNLPYKQKNYWLDKVRINFYELSMLSVCVTQCPDYANTTNLLIKNGYGHLFKFNGEFKCGKLPAFIGLYSLKGGRCSSVVENKIKFLMPTYYVKVQESEFVSGHPYNEDPCSKPPKDDDVIYQFVEQLVVLFTTHLRSIACIFVVVFANVAIVATFLLFNGSKSKVVIVVVSMTISMLLCLRFMHDHVPTHAYKESLQAIGDSFLNGQLSKKFWTDTNVRNGLAGFFWLMVNFFYTFLCAVYIKKHSLVAEKDMEINKLVIATPVLIFPLLLTYILVPLSVALPLLAIIMTLKENYEIITYSEFNNDSVKGCVYWYFMVTLTLLLLLFTSCVRTFHKNLIAKFIYSKLKEQSLLILCEEADEPRLISVAGSALNEIIMFPFCVVFEVVNIVPWKKMGLKLMKVPDVLYTTRVGSDVILPVAMFGDNRDDAYKRCVKYHKNFTFSNKFQRIVYYALLRVCVPILVVTSSNFMINFFTPHTKFFHIFLPNIAGVNPLFEHFHQFELALMVFMSYLLTSHAVDVVQTTYTCSVYYENSLKDFFADENNKTKELNSRSFSELVTQQLPEQKERKSYKVSLKTLQKLNISINRIILKIKHYITRDGHAKVYSNSIVKV